MRSPKVMRAGTGNKNIILCGLSLWNLLKSEAFRMFVNSVKLKADTLGTNIFVGFRQVSVLDRLCLWDFDQ